MSPDLKDVVEPAVEAARRALRCLYAEAPPHVVKDVSAKCEHAFAALLTDRAPMEGRALAAEARIKALEEALRKVNVILTVPAAEYVPAITEAWAIIEAALTQQSEETDHA